MERHILRPGPNDEGKRMDRILRVCFPRAALGALFAALRRGEVRVNGKKAAGDYRVRRGDEISVKNAPPFFPAQAGPQPPRSGLAAASRREAVRKTAETLIPPLVLFENDDFLALNKPRGMLSQAASSSGLSLDEYVKAYLAPRLPASLAFSPGPLHRLDRNTSGLIFFPRSVEGARAFSAALRAGEIRKTYYALVEGRLDKSETWTDNLRREEGTRTSVVLPPGEPGGKTAGTQARPLAPARRRGAHGIFYTLCEIVIHTGRTHQIRAQAALHGHPLAGDRKYGGAPLRGSPGGAYILHAARLLMPAPHAGSAPLSVHAPLPQDARRFLQSLFPQAAGPV